MKGRPIVSARLDPEVLANLDAHAKATGRTRADVIDEALRALLGMSEQATPVPAAVAAVARGT